MELSEKTAELEEKSNLLQAAEREMKSLQSNFEDQPAQLEHRYQSELSAKVEIQLEMKRLQANLEDQLKQKCALTLDLQENLDSTKRTLVKCQEQLGDLESGHQAELEEQQSVEKLKVDQLQRDLLHVRSQLKECQEEKKVLISKLELKPQDDDQSKSNSSSSVFPFHSMIPHQSKESEKENICTSIPTSSSAALTQGIPSHKFGMQFQKYPSRQTTLTIQTKEDRLRDSIRRNGKIQQRCDSIDARVFTFLYPRGQSFKAPAAFQSVRYTP